MPQKSGFFDTTADDPREYPAREFAEYFARFVGNGVFGGGEKLKVTATGKDMNVSINLGYGWINGYMYNVFDTPLVLPIQQATTQDRIDRIILRLDVSTPVRAIRAIVLQGNPGTTPQVPTIVRSGDVYDLSLAQVLVKANTSTIQGHQVTDERLNTQVCGIVTALISQADTTSIFNEFQSWLRTKTAEYQKQWDDFMKDIQDKGFATTQYVDQQISEKAASKKHYHDASDITSGTMSVDRLPSASTSNAGITQLSTATNGTRSNVAATESAVKAAMDKANEAFQSGVEWRGRIAGAINAKGVPASGNDEWGTLEWKIGQIVT
ncbi:MAG: phage tail protein, partial [Exiguobacterium sp.]